MNYVNHRCHYCDQRNTLYANRNNAGQIVYACCVCGSHNVIDDRFWVVAAAAVAPLGLGVLLTLFDDDYL
jgi:hypothetical protein